MQEERRRKLIHDLKETQGLRKRLSRDDVWYNNVINRVQRLVHLDSANVKMILRENGSEDENEKKTTLLLNYERQRRRRQPRTSVPSTSQFGSRRDSHSSLRGGAMISSAPVDSNGFWSGQIGGYSSGGVAASGGGGGSVNRHPGVNQQQVFNELKRKFRTLNETTLREAIDLIRTLNPGVSRNQRLIQLVSDELKKVLEVQTLSGARDRKTRVIPSPNQRFVQVLPGMLSFFRDANEDYLIRVLYQVIMENPGASVDQLKVLIAPILYPPQRMRGGAAVARRPSSLDQVRSEACPICYDEKSLVSLKCKHKVCRECLDGMRRDHSRLPEQIRQLTRKCQPIYTKMTGGHNPTDDQRQLLAQLTSMEQRKRKGMTCPFCRKSI